MHHWAKHDEHHAEARARFALELVFDFGLVGVFHHVLFASLETGEDRGRGPAHTGARRAGAVHNWAVWSGVESACAGQPHHDEGLGKLAFVFGLQISRLNLACAAPLPQRSQTRFSTLRFFPPVRIN